MNNLDPYIFYFDLPIYAPISIDSPDNKDFIKLITFNQSIDAYNPTLKENTTYTVTPCRINNVEYFYKYGGMEYCQLTCVRTNEKFYIFMFYDRDALIFQKIGQFPSIADFHISQIKKYDKVLSKDKLKEFTRAIGLAANGVGIGSFVYLRRIFEDLIEEAHTKAKGETGWDEDAYSKQRMAEKIELLKNFLPAFLVENKTLYGILSVGIHSLKEEDCLAYFETVKVGIELILDEKLDIYQKQKKIEDAKNKIAALTGKIQKP
jgi:hypothetical protein